ncbi:MAG TPA: choice-of-anchor C family protein [Pseudonocardiaceae bacterium]|jgi:choice-of-anchor C domain-containing protein|nr:choice-of-anchor C family protein [Pseudonocardiaceae bacterium]
MKIQKVWRGRLAVAATTIGVLSCVAVFTATPAAAASAFSNGSFETPVVAAHTFQTVFLGQSIGAWTVTTGNVDLIGDGFWQASDGVQSLDLNGDEAGGVSQTFATTPLFAYEVSYELAGNPVDLPIIKTGQAIVNGQVAQNFSFDITGKTEANMGYVHREFAFLATGGSTTLEFLSTNGGGFGPVIDDVQIEPCLLILCL